MTVEQPRLIRARYPEPWREMKLGQPRFVVLHSSEWRQMPGAARACAKDLASLRSRIASAHYIVDDAEVVQAMSEDDVAYHAPPLNRISIGVELTASASFTAEEWRSPYSLAVLERAAELVAAICQRHVIPIRFVDEHALVAPGVAGLTELARGITTHVAVSRAFGVSRHTDPGEAFPMEWFLSRVLEVGVLKLI